MAERLVIVSDMWGSKKGLWITSYLGYLQQNFNIVFYDSRDLAQIDKTKGTTEELYEAFVDGGMALAVSQLLARENEKSHYLTFCAGGTIAWYAALKGLPMKSLYAVSPMNLQQINEAPPCPVTLLFGEIQEDRPTTEWAIKTNSILEVVPNFGRELYSDEKIVKKVCLDLQELVIKKQYQF